jgi:hypothetical protein
VGARLRARRGAIEGSIAVRYFLLLPLRRQGAMLQRLLKHTGSSLDVRPLADSAPRAYGAVVRNDWRMLLLLLLWWCCRRRSGDCIELEGRRR